MQSSPDPPLPGAWFCFPQSVVRVDKYAPPEKEHRWMVVGRGSLHAGNIPVLLRSTSPGYEGIPHEAHDGACGAPDCRIDLPGWISARRSVKKAEFVPERKSCDEPSEEIIEKAKERAYQLGRANQKRRSPRTRARKK